MTILLRRKISYHLLQTYLPSGLFVIVAWLSLFLPPGIGFSKLLPKKCTELSSFILRVEVSGSIGQDYNLLFLNISTTELKS